MVNLRRIELKSSTISDYGKLKTKILFHPKQVRRTTSTQRIRGANEKEKTENREG